VRLRRTKYELSGRVKRTAAAAAAVFVIAVSSQTFPPSQFALSPTRGKTRPRTI
jgi:hypothetical protein